MNDLKDLIAVLLQDPCDENLRFIRALQAVIKQMENV